MAAGRHLHNVPTDFEIINPCTPQTFTGFMGNHVTVSTSDTVRGFKNALCMSTSHTSVRFVGYMLDEKGDSITFTKDGAHYISPFHRNFSVLYSMIPNAIIRPSVPVFISVPIQVRREAIHRFDKYIF